MSESLEDLRKRLDRVWTKCEATRRYADEYQDEWPRISKALVEMRGFIDDAASGWLGTVARAKARDLLARLDKGEK